ncbi:transmembrane amino acid transporter protein domain-containing protein [Ditylenchus destructor]|uniref:Transmembrane amino acid transporter protein domain-containing protein n=1 Tax=Ditylenchus destructor TaxID=166010 RepID=A0AAD4N8I8_9BILA|nr:transmembrane amino acid transporter protein domain-containing protein [Ditylenchus destructor]
MNIYNDSSNGNTTREKVPMSSFTTNSSGSFSTSVPPKFDGEDGADENSYFYKDGKLQKAKGLGWVVTGLFVVGDLAGGGLVALPTAMLEFGFAFGMFFTVLMSFTVCYTAYVLGQCWCILQRRWPQHYTRGHVRKPYPEIGGRAMGPRMNRFVSGCVLVTQFGVAIAFFDTDIGFCVIVLIVALCLLPVTFLKSPQDFWGAVVLAMFTTSIAVVLILLGTSLDYGICAPERRTPEFRITNYFLALGTFIFSYGGHAVFPTIQHDMKKPHEFTKSSILAFTIIAMMYTPVSIMGYLTYGDSLRDSIINSLQTKWIQQTVNMLITIHCILTLTIVFNPINQEAEEYFQVPQHFGLKRVFVRTGTLLAVVFVGETLPTFGPLLDFVGGSTMALSSIIFPCVFYLYLSVGERKANENALHCPKNGITTKKGLSEVEDEPVTLVDILERTDRVTLFVCTFFALFGIMGGAAATFSAVREMSYAHFVPPCYISAFLDSVSDPNAGGHTNCCGFGQNISRYGDPALFCSDPEYGAYS